MNEIVVSIANGVFVVVVSYLVVFVVTGLFVVVVVVVVVVQIHVVVGISFRVIHSHVGRVGNVFSDVVTELVVHCMTVHVVAPNVFLEVLELKTAMYNDET